jgi:hypothetical protein
MSISAAEAAKLTGLSKQAVINAIKSGKISAIKDVDGHWSIEPVELFRHYQPVSSVNGNHHQELDEAIQHVDTLLDAPSMDSLRVEVKLLREVLGAKDDVIASKDDTIADLRSRLDAEQEERRRLSMMLMDTQVVVNPAPPSPVVESAPQADEPKGFWQRLFGR